MISYISRKQWEEITSAIEGSFIELDSSKRYILILPDRDDINMSEVAKRIYEGLELDKSGDKFRIVILQGDSIKLLEF